MTNLELQEYLKQFPNDMPIMIMNEHITRAMKDIGEEDILLTSKTAHVNPHAPEEEWDTEDGKVELGPGQQYLLFNPIVY